MDILKIAVNVLHVIVAIAIIVLVLFQSGKTSGLSGSIGGASETFFGKNKGRTMDAKFSKFTKLCAVLFLATSLFLAYSFALTKNTQTPSDIGSTVEYNTAAPGVSVAPTDSAQNSSQPASAQPAQ